VVQGAPETLVDEGTSANAIALPDVASRATELSALLDGLWVEWCLSDAPFAPAEGRAICDHWIDRFLAAPITD
jgi:hypothetical protein